MKGGKRKTRKADPPAGGEKLKNGMESKENLLMRKANLLGMTFYAFRLMSFSQRHNGGFINNLSNHLTLLRI